MRSIASILATVVVAGIMLYGCSKKDEQTLTAQNPGDGSTTPVSSCDTVNMKFSANIKPILQANCYSCHGNGLSQNGVNFDTYNGVLQQVNNGNLIGAITHAPGYPAMPQGGAKLSDCDINKIRDWIAHGAPNN